MTHNLKLGRNQWSTECFGSAMPVDTLDVQLTPASIAKRYSAAGVQGDIRDEVLV